MVDNLQTLKGIKKSATTFTSNDTYNKNVYLSY